MNVSCARRFAATCRFLAAAISLIFFLTSAAAAASSAPLRVASLSTVLSEVAREVGRERVEVIEIIKPGVDPHEFQPAPGDVKLVSSATLVLVSGKGLEGYLSKLEASAGNGGRGKFVAIGDALPTLKMNDAGKTVDDPHWWHSVSNVKKAVAIVRDALTVAATTDAADKDLFAKNAAAYLRRLDELENTLKLKVAELPRDRRKLVTSHDAFGYLARDYGFTIYPLKGVATSDEPSSKKVAALIGTIKKEGVKAVFFEAIENPKAIAEITRETGAKIGGKLYADGLGPAGSDAATYAEMMRHNVNTIVEALK